MNRALLRLFAVRHLRASPGRSFLTLLGIVLGVAVIFAIDVVNGSVLASFRSTIDDVAGKTALQVGGGDDSGVPEELLDEVRAVPGVATAVPVIVESARDSARGEQLAILAVDTLADSKVRDYDVGSQDVTIDDELAFLNDPAAVLITREYSARTGVKVGDVLALETVRGKKDFTVRGLLAARGPAKIFGGDVLLMDVYAAQIAFGRDKRFDRIDVVPDQRAAEDVDALAARITAAIHDRAPVTRPARRSAEAERILAGFRVGLSLASLVAIFVGGFIVYNALAIAVAQRRREIGILRALGASRRAVLLMFLGEGLVIGLVGSVIGVFCGALLARVVLGAVGTTVSELYMRVKPEGLAIRPLQLVAGVTAGVAASLAAALFPAREAATIEPAIAMRRSAESSEAIGMSSTRGSLIACAIAIASAVGLALVAHARQSFLLGYGVAAILAFAAAFGSPALARAIGRLARPLATRAGPVTRLGADGFARNARRNAITIAALGMALGNVLIIAAFLGSIQTSVLDWFRRSIRADLFVFAGREVKAKFEHPLPDALTAELATLPGVELVNPFRMVKQTYRGEPFYLISHDLRGYARYNEIPVVEGSFETALPKLEAGTGIAASETFSHTFHVHLGDRVTLSTPDGPREFEIAMVYVDYTADIGLLCLPRSVYQSIWRDSLVDSFGLYLAKAAKPTADALQRQVADRWGKQYGLMVLQNDDYQREVVRLIDRSFALTRAMEVVALLVAILGIVNTLLVTVIDRRREIGILKAIGAMRGQIVRTFLVEAGLIGLAATVSGLAIGGVFSLYIVRELIRYQVGWSLTYRFPWADAAQLFLVAQLVSWIGALFPARAAARLDVVDALEYE